MKRVIVAAVGAGLLLTASIVGGAWYLAGEIERAALEVGAPKPRLDLVVTQRADDAITLRPRADIDRHHSAWRRSGRFGIVSVDGSGVVGDIIDDNGDEVTRRLVSFNSSVAPGDNVRLRAMCYFGDPLSVHGLAFDDIVFESDVGQLGAWSIGGSSDTWVIFVHGRAAGRDEGLAILPALVELGLPTLAIQYRNDDGVARSASGFYDYGLTEWRDLEAAVGYALAEGAEDVVLFGSSMGGSIVLSFLYRSDLADRVRGVILDSPLLDLGDVIDFGGERRKIWSPLVGLGKTAAAIRYSLPWDELNYLERADDLAVPILLFHGAADRVVHIRKSDALAAVRSDIVTYVRLDDVGHVEAWNVDQDGYERALADFLGSLTGGEPSSGPDR